MAMVDPGDSFYTGNQMRRLLGHLSFAELVGLMNEASESQVSHAQFSQCQACCDEFIWRLGILRGRLIFLTGYQDAIFQKEAITLVMRALAREDFSNSSGYGAEVGHGGSEKKSEECLESCYRRLVSGDVALRCWKQSAESGFSIL